MAVDTMYFLAFRSELRRYSCSGFHIQRRFRQSHLSVPRDLRMFLAIVVALWFPHCSPKWKAPNTSQHCLWLWTWRAATHLPLLKMAKSSRSICNSTACPSWSIFPRSNIPSWSWSAARGRPPGELSNRCLESCGAHRTSFWFYSLKSWLEIETNTKNPSLSSIFSCI